MSAELKMRLCSLLICSPAFRRLSARCTSSSSAGRRIRSNVLPLPTRCLSFSRSSSRYYWLVSTGHGFLNALVFCLAIFSRAQRAPKLPTSTADTPHISTLQIIDIRKCKTMGPVLRGINTNKGMLARSLPKAFQEDGPLATSQLQDFALQIDGHTFQSRLALLSDGHAGEVVALSKSGLHRLCAKPRSQTRSSQLPWIAPQACADKSMIEARASPCHPIK